MYLFYFANVKTVGVVDADIAVYVTMEIYHSLRRRGFSHFCVESRLFSQTRTIAASYSYGNETKINELLSPDNNCVALVAIRKQSGIPTKAKNLSSVNMCRKKKKYRYLITGICTRDGEFYFYKEKIRYPTTWRLYILNRLNLRRTVNNFRIFIIDSKVLKRVFGEQKLPEINVRVHTRYRHDVITDLSLTGFKRHNFQ